MCAVWIVCAVCEWCVQCVDGVRRVRTRVWCVLGGKAFFFLRRQDFAVLSASTHVCLFTHEPVDWCVSVCVCVTHPGKERGGQACWELKEEGSDRGCLCAERRLLDLCSPSCSSEEGAGANQMNVMVQNWKD